MDMWKYVRTGDGWDITAAKVMCRELNYSSEDAVLIDGPLNDEDTAVFFEKFQCSDTVKNLKQCSYKFSQNHKCSIAAMACEDIIHTDMCSKSTEMTSVDGYLRYGECSVYESITDACDGILEPGTDYVYVSHKLGNQITISSLLYEKIKEAEGITALHSQLYVEKVYEMLCHYYLPPCGNATKRVPPTSLCFDECQTIQDECSIVWNAVLSALRTTGYVINCRGTSNLLFPVKHCCSTVIKDTTPTPTATVPYSATPTDINGGIIAGIVTTILLIIALMTVGIVISVIFISKKLKIQKMNRVQQDIFAVGRNDVPQVELSMSNKGSSEMQGGDESTNFTTTLADINTYDVPDTLKVSERMPRVRVTTSHMRELVRGKFLVKNEDITLMECIGEGEFGIVYKAKLGLSKREVAIKTVKGNFDQVEVDKFVEKSLKLSRFKHSHVMGLIGVCLDAGSAPYIIMPYMANGSLLSFLKRERKKLVITEEIDEDDIMEVTKRLMVMCYQIVSGMEYLASEKYIHRDLAARNCMIDTHFLIKITDFGLSEDIFERNYFRQENERDVVKLPIKWMAPESLSDGHFSEKSDVWSYGVTMWEIFSGGKAPYPGTDPLTLIQSLEQGNRMPQPYNSACNGEIYGIMRSCWEIVPDERPFFHDLSTTVVKYIEQISGYLQISFNPFSDEQDFGIGKKSAK